MNTRKAFMLTFCGLVSIGLSQPVWAQPHKVVEAKDGSGVFGYKDTPIQPWSGYHVHDPDRPAPPKVTPPPADADGVSAPSDALILFEGEGLEQWAPNGWRVEDGCLIATEGPMETVEEFGDCQLHLEWAVPTEPEESQWNRGNNGVFFLNRGVPFVWSNSQAPVSEDILKISRALVEEEGSAATDEEKEPAKKSLFGRR